MDKYLRLLSRGDRLGLTLIRLSIAIVFIWIGLLKFVPYGLTVLPRLWRTVRLCHFSMNIRRNIVSI